ncbi:hypothetical protein D3C73_1266160 [compost metagenome]
MLPVVIHGIARNCKHYQHNDRDDHMGFIQSHETFPLTRCTRELAVFRQSLLFRFTNFLLVQTVQNKLKGLKILLRRRSFVIGRFGPTPF